MYWRPEAEAKQLLSAMVATPEEPLMTYCNPGHVSALAWFALSEIGGVSDVSLYDGSLHEWTLDGDQELFIGR